MDTRLTGWRHTGIRVSEVDEARPLRLDDLGVERIIVPLAGSFEIAHRDQTNEYTTSLHGRVSVFAGRTDVVYLPTQTTAEIRGQGRIAIAEAPTTEPRPWRYIARSDVPVELRGAGQSSRQVHNFGTPQVLDAARLIACEVITPAGNWSSYPPHKHDQHVPAHESRLEEIYYFESAPVRGSTTAAETAFGMFTAYSSSVGQIAINAMVRSGDVALVPFGYHGPAVAAPGYDLYYLNVMAGPDPERVWLSNDDPAHAWVRDTWLDQDVDARLPYPDDKRER